MNQDPILLLTIILICNSLIFGLGITLGVHITKRKHEVKEDGAGNNTEDILDGVLNSN